MKELPAPSREIQQQFLFCWIFIKNNSLKRRLIACDLDIPRRKLTSTIYLVLDGNTFFIYQYPTKGKFVEPAWRFREMFIASLPIYI